MLVKIIFKVKLKKSNCLSDSKFKLENIIILSLDNNITHIITYIKYMLMKKD